MIRSSCLLLATLLAMVLGAAEHPRLIIGAAELPALREKVRAEPWKSMVDRLIADADANEWGTPNEGEQSTYTQSCIAERAAFLHLLTGDDSWAAKARGMVEQRLADGKEWGNGGAFGLRLYWHGMRMSLVYDWCHGAPSWDAAFSAKVSQELRRHGEAILKQGGKSQNQNPASNWQGGRWSSGGLCLLACDEPLDEQLLAQAYRRTEQYLRENLGTDVGSRGWNIEGLGYTFFPMGNYVHPFAVAMQRRDPALDLRQACTGAAWTYWTCYATSVQTAQHGLVRPDFGDDNAGTNAEGCLGQAFWWCPPELHPGFAWWYHRTRGAGGDATWDNSRCGTIWSILHHPGPAAPEADPMSIPEWTAAFTETGGNGYITWRNAYRGDGDIVGQLYLKLRGNRGHSGPDALSFRLLGLGTPWAVGGGRYGKGNVYHQSMNTLYPAEPEQVQTSKESGQLVGEPLGRPDGSGHVVARIGTNNVGTHDQRRYMIADFARSGAAACFIIGDTSQDGRFWQLCTLPHYEISTEGQTFTIAGADGATLRGTVLYGSGGPRFATGVRQRGSGYSGEENRWLTCQSDDGEHLVVLTIVPAGGTHPEARLEGDWGAEPAATVHVGGLRVGIVGDVITYP